MQSNKGKGIIIDNIDNIVCGVNILTDYILKLNELLLMNKKNEFYQNLLEYSNLVYEKIKLDNDKVIKFNEILNIIEAAMEIDDAVIIMDIIENEFTLF